MYREKTKQEIEQVTEKLSYYGNGIQADKHSIKLLPGLIYNINKTLIDRVFKLEEHKLRIKTIEEEYYLLIREEKMPDGKLKYSNEKLREAAIKKQVKDDTEYQTERSLFLECTFSIKELEAFLEYLRRMHDSLLVVAKNLYKI